jgi:GNAT superfamily N-acetyltransferase
LQDLFTSEAYRGRGIGRALILGFYEKATESGSSRAYWQTQQSNAPARLLYDKVAVHSGFIVYTRREA